MIIRFFKSREASKKSLCFFIIVLFLFFNDCTKVNFNEDDPPYEKRVKRYAINLMLYENLQAYNKVLKFSVPNPTYSDGTAIKNYTVLDDELNKPNHNYLFKAESEHASDVIWLEVSLKEPINKEATLKVVLSGTGNGKKLKEKSADITHSSFSNKNQVKKVSLKLEVPK